jgi:hypothetical protein
VKAAENEMQAEKKANNDERKHRRIIRMCIISMRIGVTFGCGRWCTKVGRLRARVSSCAQQLLGEQRASALGAELPVVSQVTPPRSTQATRLVRHRMLGLRVSRHLLVVFVLFFS